MADSSVDAANGVQIDIGTLAAGKAREDLIGRVWPRCKCPHSGCHCGPAKMVAPSGNASTNFDVTDTPCKCVTMHLFAVHDDCNEGTDAYAEVLKPLAVAGVKPGLLGVESGPCSLGHILSKLEPFSASFVPKGSRMVSVHPSEGPLVDGVPCVRSANHFRVNLPHVAVVKNKHVNFSSQDAVQQASSLSLPLAKLRLLQRRAAPAHKTTGGTTTKVVLLHVPTIKCTSCTQRIYRALKKLGLVLSQDCYASTQTKEVAAIVPRDEDPAAFEGRVVAALTALELPPQPRTEAVKFATLSIEGMSCMGCVGRVTKACAPIDVEVLLAEKEIKNVPLDHVDHVIRVVQDLQDGRYKVSLKEIAEESMTQAVPTVVDVAVSVWDQRVEAMMAPEFVRGGEGIQTGVPQAPPSPSTGSAATGTAATVINIEASAPTLTSNFGVKGMTCSSCVARIEDALLEVPGIASATVVLGTESAKVRHVETLTAEKIAELVTEMGYPTTILSDEESSDDLKKRLSKEEAVATLKRNATAALLLAAPLIVMMMLAPHVQAVEDFMMYPLHPHVTLGLAMQLLLSTPSVFVYARPFFRNGWAALSHGSFTMDVLVMLGVGTAYASGWLYLFFGVGNPAADTAAVLTGFMLLGRYLETLAKSRTADELKSLLELRPETALLVSGHEDKPIAVPADSIRKGDVILVAAGDRVAVDGVLSKGTLEVDQSMLTGESIPVHKDLGDGVTGGTICVSGMAHITATHVGADSTLNQIIKLITDAQASKAPIQKMADQIAGRFVPLVLTIAAGSFVAWIILGALNVYPAEWREGSSVFAFALNFLLATLVVACPCAMGLATPTAVMVATGVGARLGIFIKGAESMEGAARVRAVLFDKTGTLTKGEITVQESEYFGKAGDKKRSVKYMAYIAAAEDGTRHPIATAVASACRRMAQAGGEMNVPDVSNHATAPGHGIHCTIKGQKVVVGNAKWVMANNKHVNVSSAVKRWEAEGMTVVLAAVDKEVVWGFGLRDTLKPEAHSVVRYLQDKGFKVCIVTGDNAPAAQAVAKSVGIPPQDVFAEVLPGDKAATVRAVQDQGFKTAFVGDGINDAPALAAADIGIALGSGTSVAIESADIVLTKSNLEDVPCLLSLSKTALNRIRLNFVWAFGYNTLALPVACGLTFPITGQLPPVLGGIAMIMSSLLVLTSSLMLRLFTRPHIKQVVVDSGEKLLNARGVQSYGAC